MTSNFPSLLYKRRKTCIFVFTGASYTANLASFLVTDVFETPINSLEDLAAQTKIKYGCAKDSHTMAFFQMSRVPTYAKMWAFMKRHDTLVENVTEGIRRVRKGGYAFISESAVLDYYTEQRPCNTLTTIGRYGVSYVSYVFQLDEFVYNQNQVSILYRIFSFLLAIQKKKKHGGSYGKCNKFLTHI